jgi:hypothetical protein
MSIHTYRYSSKGPVDRLGGSKAMFNAVRYRPFFESFNDPAKWGLFYHAALIVRRGDVQEGPSRAIIDIPDDPSGAWRLKRQAEMAGIPLANERYRVGMSIPGHRPDADVRINPEAALVDPEVGEVRSENGQLYRSWKRGFATIDTPRTKAAYGKLGAAGLLALDGLELRIDTAWATVAVSSLTDDSIDDSAAVLVTAVGRCENTDMRFNAERRWLIDFGRSPILIEVIEGDVAIRTSRQGLTVWMVGETGENRTQTPSRMDEGWLRFRIGPLALADDAVAPPDSTIYYLVTA